MNIALLQTRKERNGGRTVPKPSIASSPKPVGFLVRTTLSACFAFLIADIFNVFHPWWAAMTVWLVAQPTRGLLIERSLARSIGTILGALVGALILLFIPLWPFKLMALSLWLAICAGCGSLFLHFRNYSFVLSGYTASIIVMFSFIDSSGSAQALDRVVCCFIGIFSSMLFSYRSLPRPEQSFLSQADTLLTCTLQHIENCLSGKKASSETEIIQRIQQLDDEIDESAAGSLTQRKMALRIRSINGILLELLALTAKQKPCPFLNIPDSSSYCDTKIRIKYLADITRDTGELALSDTLGELLDALEKKTRLKLHVLPALFWRASLRPVIALSVATLLWQTTGWSSGPLMVMTAVLFSSLFSNHTEGNKMVFHVFLGTILGGIMGSMTRLYLLPLSDEVVETVLLIMPGLLAGAWLMRYRATTKMSLDSMMTFLLVAQPGALPANASIVMSEALAITAGVFVAVITLQFILPAKAKDRKELLIKYIAQLTLTAVNAPKTDLVHEALRRLRIAETQLLSFVSADSDIFQAGQTCLARSRMVLTARIHDTSTTSLTLHDYNHSALTASSTLKNSIKKTKGKQHESE